MVELFPDTTRDCAVPRSDAPGHTPAPPCITSPPAETAAASWLKLWRPVLMRALALGFGALFLAGLGSASLHEQGSRLNSISLSQLRAASLLDTGGSDWLKPDPSQSSVIYNNHNEATQERPFRAPNARGSSKGFEDSALATGAQGESAPDVASETPTNKPSTEAVEKVILNEAGASELRRLPGVGVRRAEQILALRAQVGHFRKLSDLLRVKGIGPKLFRRMLPMLLLDRPVSPAPKPSVPAGT